MAKKALLGQVGDSETRLLKIFKVVVDCGGLSAAELELNIGRSTVSRHVKDLEERLGLVLCRRGRAGFALTAEGQRVYDGAQRLFNAMETFRNDVRDLHADLVGHLVLGVFDKTVTNPQSRISTAVRDFRRLAPEVSIDINIDTIAGIESAVMDGRMQVGIVPDHRRSESLSYHGLFGERMYLYCGKQHPLFNAEHGSLTWADLQDYDCAGLAFHSPNMEATHRLRLRRHASVTDQEAIAMLILSGCYIGFLPNHYASTFLGAGLVQRVEHPECMYDVQFVAMLRRSPEPSRVAQAFLETLSNAHALTG